MKNKNKSYQNKLKYIHEYNKENYKHLYITFREEEEVYKDIVKASNKAQKIRDYYKAYKKTQ